MKTTVQEAMMEVVIISLSPGREDEHGKEKEVCDGWGKSLRLLFTFPAQ